MQQPSAAATLSTLDGPDQWTLGGEFGALRPLDKYSWPDGQAVYVSEVTGEVVQATTSASRLGAYFGAIPHWLYFTPLRENGLLWSRVVIWTSGIGAVTALLGLLVGVWMYLPSKRIPYTGQKRWHVFLGLIFGFFACTWAFSGMLSMDPFPFSAGPQEIGGRIDHALPQRGDLRLWIKPWRMPFREPRKWISSSSRPILRRIFSAVRDAVRPDTVSEFRTSDRIRGVLHLDRHHRHPLAGAVRARPTDAGESMFYIDPKTARIVDAYDSASRWNRWLYHGLHSLDLPWLYAHRPAWDIVILALLIGGVSLGRDVADHAAGKFCADSFAGRPLDPRRGPASGQRGCRRKQRNADECGDEKWGHPPPWRTPPALLSAVQGVPTFILRVSPFFPKLYTHS